MKYDFPPAAPGLSIGILGGSFDPAHAGHVRITRAALRRFGLDRVWWLVSPGNPLKTRGPAPLEQRLARARQVMQHPRVTVTGVEAALGTRLTAETIAALQAKYPRQNFVWMMGADNLAQFDQWHGWREIAMRVPIGVIARPGERSAALHSRAARILGAYQLRPRQSQLLARSAPPAWCFINMPMTDISSTEIRARTGWGESA